MPDTKTVKIFVASSGELIAEREKSILLIHELNESHTHLNLKAVEWEYAIVKGNAPGFADIQDSINPELRDSDLVVFVFYSKIGPYTRQEYEVATEGQKKIFPFFKAGFSPKKPTIAAYGELLSFRDEMEGKVIPMDYIDFADFKGQLYAQLNLYLAKHYPPTVAIAADSKLSESNATLIRLLADKEDEIKKLKAANDALPAAANQAFIEALTQEKNSLQQELLRSKEIQEQQAKDKAALEEQLSLQKDTNALKAKALEEVGKGNYAEAEGYLKESAKSSIEATAETFYELAKIKKLQFLYKEALTYYDLAIKINPDTLRYLNDAGIIAGDMGLPDKAIGYYTAALAMADKGVTKEPVDFGPVSNNIGEMYREKGNYLTAIDYYLKAIKYDTEKYGSGYWKIASYNNNLGLAYNDNGEYDKGMSYYQLALPVFIQSRGELSEETAAVYNNMGLYYFDKEKYDDAITYIEKAKAIYEIMYPNGHPDITLLNSSIGLAYNDKEEYDKAFDYFDKALTTGRKYYGEEHPRIATFYNNMGLLYDNKKDYRKAIEYYEKALVVYTKIYGAEHPSIAVTYSNIGNCFYEKGDDKTAIAYFEKALTVNEKFFPPEHQKIINLTDIIRIVQEDLAKLNP